MNTKREIIDMYEKFERYKSNSKEYDIELRKFNVLTQELYNIMNKEQKKKLNLLLQVRNDMETIETKDYFIGGFKKASRLMADVFYKEDT